MTRQLFMDAGVLMGRVVINDQMQVQFVRCLGDDLLEELDKLLVTVPWHALPDRAPLSHIECGEQRRRASALVVVGHRLATSGIDRQALLRAVECLNLAFLIEAEDLGVLGWVEVKTDEIGQLLHEFRVVAHLEGSDQVRLQPIGRERG